MRPVQYRAPSFSWAALDEPIEFPLYPQDDLLMAPEIMGVNLDYETEDVFGAISGGYLTVRCYLYRILLSSPQDPRNPYNFMTMQIFRVGRQHNNETIVESVVYKTDAARGSFDEDLDDVESYSKEDLYCIPRASGDPGSFLSIDFLVLQLVNREEAHYALRGLFTISPRGWEIHLHPYLHYPCIQYDEGKHTIRLV